jgi:hypothetical protein
VPPCFIEAREPSSGPYRAADPRGARSHLTPSRRSGPRIARVGLGRLSRRVRAPGHVRHRRVGPVS